MSLFARVSEREREGERERPSEHQSQRRESLAARNSSHVRLFPSGPNSDIERDVSAETCQCEKSLGDNFQSSAESGATGEALIMSRRDSSITEPDTSQRRSSSQERRRRYNVYRQLLYHGWNILQ